VDQSVGKITERCANLRLQFLFMDCKVAHVLLDLGAAFAGVPIANN